MRTVSNCNRREMDARAEKSPWSLYTVVGCLDTDSRDKYGNWLNNVFFVCVSSVSTTVPELLTCCVITGLKSVEASRGLCERLARSCLHSAVPSCVQVITQSYYHLRIIISNSLLPQRGKQKSFSSIYGFLLTAGLSSRGCAPQHLTKVYLSIIRHCFEDPIGF